MSFAKKSCLVHATLSNVFKLLLCIHTCTWLEFHNFWKDTWSVLHQCHPELPVVFFLTDGLVIFGVKASFSIALTLTT